jgi:hypothetical protein
MKMMNKHRMMKTIQRSSFGLSQVRMAVKFSQMLRLRIHSELSFTAISQLFEKYLFVGNKNLFDYFGGTILAARQTPSLMLRVNETFGLIRVV